MATKNPRVNVTLSDDDLKMVSLLSKKRKKSLSMTMRELIEMALETHEDLYLYRLARERCTDEAVWISHEDAWK